MTEKLDNMLQLLIERGIFQQISVLYQRAGQIIYHRELVKTNAVKELSGSPVYLVASITKPIVAMSFLKLVEAGEVALNQRASEFLPGFKSDGRQQITMRHLLAHTSGLPDLPPDNVELRKQAAPLTTFLDRAMSLPLDFAPGKSSRYASLGFMVLGEVIRIITGMKLADYLQQLFFEPLGMHNTSLGLPEDTDRCNHMLQRLIPVEMSDFEIEKYGDWNSNYWRRLGAPWGGLLSSVGDLSKFCQMINQQGEYQDQRVLSPLTIKTAIENQHHYYRDLPLECQDRPWGLGWRLNWQNHRQAFSELLPRSVIGHYGATGTLMWIDLATQTSCVLLTSTPQERSQLEMIKLSNYVSTL